MNKIISRKPIFLLLLTIFFVSTSLILSAQITVYQYRHVPDDKVQEFVRRETTYWSKVAEAATKNKTMTFWALLEKVGGYDLPNSSNFLFINTFPDIDKAGDAFGQTEKITGMKLSDIETGSMSTVTSEFFLHDEDWAQVKDVNPDKDFNYIIMNYHNSSMPDSFITLEKKYWHPFIQKAMDSKQTTQKAWGNARVLSPMGDNIKFNTVSYDLFSTLQQALMPTWDQNVMLPMDGLNLLDKIRLNRSGTVVYRIVKVVSSGNN